MRHTIPKPHERLESRPIPDPTFSRPAPQLAGRPICPGPMAQSVDDSLPCVCRLRWGLLKS